MQVTIYLTEQDEYLLRLVDELSQRERKSRSAVILSILEEHFEHDHHLGEILVDVGTITTVDLTRALESQSKRFTDKLLGEVLASEHGIDEESIERALAIQSRFR